MNAKIIRVDYGKLDQIKQKLAHQADICAEMQSQLLIRTTNLQQGGWTGDAAVAFYNEMQDVIFPALKRLNHALDEAGYTVQQIIEIFGSAENEASSSFKE